MYIKLYHFQDLKLITNNYYNHIDAETCQGAMIASGILPVLISLATDGPYHTLEISRESARILGYFIVGLFCYICSFLLFVWLFFFTPYWL
jgi:hypothetical protein